MCSAKWCQIYQVFGPWESPYGANGQMIMTLQNFRSRQFHRTSNGKNPPSDFRNMHSAKIWQLPDRPTARTVAIIPHQHEGLRGKISTHMFYVVSNMNAIVLVTTGDRLLTSDRSLPVSEPATQIAKFIGANMEPTWVLSAPDGPHVGPWTLLSGKLPLCCLEQGQYWLRYQFIARRHQVITLTTCRPPASEILWHLPASNFTSASATILHDRFKIQLLKFQPYLLVSEKIATLLTTVKPLA